MLSLDIFILTICNILTLWGKNFIQHLKINTFLHTKSVLTNDKVT